MASKVTVEEVNAFLLSVFLGRGEIALATEIGDGYARARLGIDQSNLRPGGYISGPTQMAIADSSAYMAVFTQIGITPMALTSNLNINFMRPCIGEAVTADATVLKMGKTLAVINVDIRAEGSDKLSSQAVVNYSIPPETAE